MTTTPIITHNESDGWEDVAHHQQPVEPLVTSPRLSPAPSSTTSSRNTRRRTIHVAIPSNRRPLIPKKPLRSQPTPPRVPVIDKQAWINALAVFASNACDFAFHILARAIRYLRIPLSILVFLWLLTFIISIIGSTLTKALAPLCVIPGVSHSPLCSVSKLATTTSVTDSKQPQWADYPRMIEVQSINFEQLLDQSAGGSGLSLEIKKAEMATSDLVTLVRVSQLNSRDVLAISLLEFVEEARKTGRGLQKLNAKIGGAVDSVLAVNDYALHAIEAAHTANTAARSSLIPWRRPSANTDAIITSTFTDAMSVLSTHMSRLVLAAQVPLSALTELEERLTTMHSILLREDTSLTSMHHSHTDTNNVLSSLWSKLVTGKNKQELRSYTRHMELLRELGEYRKRALVHVVGALQTLEGMSEEMEELRERVAAPELTGGVDGRIPIEVHMKSIRSGLERLREGRIRAREREEETVRRILGGGDGLD